MIMILYIDLSLVLSKLFINLKIICCNEYIEFLSNVLEIEIFDDLSKNINQNLNFISFEIL